MRAIRAVGQGAAARKYDLFTALGAYGLARSKHDQRLVLRLITLITARYDWARDELAVGQREIARLWSVDERTVKREMARLRQMGWLRQKRAAARGRVAEYGLGQEIILADTRPHWTAVGPDFAARLGGTEEAAPTGQVLPFPAVSPRGQPEPPTGAATLWGRAQHILADQDPALYQAWLSRLEQLSEEGQRLVLTAPSAFHASYVRTHLSDRIAIACRRLGVDVTDIVLEVRN